MKFLKLLFVLSIIEGVLEWMWGHAPELVVFILVTTGAIWIAIKINNLLHRFREKENRVSEVINKHIPEINLRFQSIDTRITDLGTSMDRKMENLSATVDIKIEKLSMSVDEKIEKLSVSVDQKIEKLSGSVDQKIEKLSGSVDQKIEKLSASVDKKHDTTDRRVENLSQSIDRKLEKMSGSISELSVTVASLAANLAGMQSLLETSLQHNRPPKVRTQRSLPRTIKR